MVEQTVRRVAPEEMVVAQEKLVSLFEPHTQIIVRRKTGKSVEFGRKEWLKAVEGGRIRGDRILAEASQDFPYSAASLAAQQQGFGRLRRLPAADRVVYSAANEATAQKARGTRIVIPCGGKSSPARVAADYVLEGNCGEIGLWRGGFLKIFPEV